MVQSSNKLLSWEDYRKYSPTFIETGTCFGRTVELAIEAGFQNIKSVEAKEEFYKECVKKISPPAGVHVELYLGKSVDRLPVMLEDVKNPAVFWLDAHVSGEISAGYEDWVEKQGESDYDQHKILKKELEIILAHRPDHIILIDDQNGNNFMNEEYVESIQKVNPYYSFYFIDEQMGNMFYKDKILVCIP